MGPSFDERAVSFGERCLAISVSKQSDWIGLAQFAGGDLVRFSPIARRVSGVDSRAERRAEHIFLAAHFACLCALDANQQAGSSSKYLVSHRPALLRLESWQ